jgi:hypothetical protein
MRHQVTFQSLPAYLHTAHLTGPPPATPAPPAPCVARTMRAAKVSSSPTLEGVEHVLQPTRKQQLNRGQTVKSIVSPAEKRSKFEYALFAWGENSRVPLAGTFKLKPLSVSWGHAQRQRRKKHSTIMYGRSAARIRDSNVVHTCHGATNKRSGASALIRDSVPVQM